MTLTPITLTSVAIPINVRSAKAMTAEVASSILRGRLMTAERVSNIPHDRAMTAEAVNNIPRDRNMTAEAVNNIPRVRAMTAEAVNNTPRDRAMTAEAANNTPRVRAITIITTTDADSPVRRATLTAEAAMTTAITEDPEAAMITDPAAGGRRSVQAPGSSLSE